MRISKKILAAVLAALMAISMMPFTAFATEYEAGSQITGSQLQTGDKIFLEGTNIHALFGGAVLKAGQFLEFSSYRACQNYNKANGTVTSSDIYLSDDNLQISEYYFKYVEDYESGKCYVPIDENGNVLEYILVLEKTDEFEPITFGTYVAPVTYTVTWKNADGTTLETDTDVAEGTVPTYDGATPAKASDLENSYTFAGWSPAVAAVTGDVTYTAQYTATQLPVETVSYSFSQFNDWTQYASERDFRFSGDEYLLWVKKADHVVGTFSSDDGYEFLGNFGSYDLVGPANVTVTENNGDYILTGKVLTVNKDDSTDERIYNLTISTEAPPAAPDPDPSIPTGTTRTVIWDCYNDTEYKIGTSSSSPTYTQDGVTATSSGINLQTGMSKPGYSLLVSSGSKGVFTFSTESGMFTKIKLTGYEQWSGKLNSGWVVENGECVWTGKSDKVIIASSQTFSVDFNTIEFTIDDCVPVVKPDGFNLTVEDKVQMNLYINVDDYTDPETATVEVTYNDPEAQTPTDKTDTYSGEALAALKDTDDGRYVIPVLAAPAQIRDDVTVTVTDRDEPITTSVAEYCETIIAQSEDGALVGLANAILDYGKACSDEFNYNEAAFADKEYHYSGLNVTEYLNSNAVINTENVNGKFTGYSYIAKAVPALRIYLNTTEAEVVANDLKATVNGTEVTPKVEEGTGYVCVDITGILAENLDAMQTVEFNGGTLTLNALQYAKAKGGDTDFGRSMAVYNFIADAYFA